VLGAILCVALIICSRNLRDRGGPSFIASSAVAGLAYLLAIREFFSTPGFPRRVVVIGLVLAALWHFQFLRMPSGPDDDIHRYVWDGRIQRLGYNPYIVVPSDPAVRGLHTTETRNLNNPDVPSPYPAGAQLFFRAVTAIHESTFALKVAFVVCDFAIIFVLLDVLRRDEQGAQRAHMRTATQERDASHRDGATNRVPVLRVRSSRAHLVLAYAWNPLLAIEVAGSGHIDIVGALLLLMSFAALGRRWRAIGAVAFGLAVAVKLLPIVLLPLYWKRIRKRDAIVASAVVGLLYVPFLNHTRIPIGSLLTYVQTFRFNDLVFAKLEQAAPQIAAGLPVLVGFVTATWLRSTLPEWSPDVFAWPMAASLLCAPVVYPWYLLWLLPFLSSVSTLPIVIWTVSIIPTYVVWHLRTLGHPWLVPGWIMLLEYGSVATAGVMIVLRRLTRPAVSRCSMDQAG
jgi:alpha-1,6-mannosyltransferase